MPIPKPGEGEEAYIGRCMGHPGMNDKYPDAAQRAAVCHSIYREGEKLAVALGIVEKARQPKDMRLSASPAPDLKAKAEGTGEITGYASVFDNVDAQGDIIRKGAFTKTIKERVKAGKVLLMIRHFAHGGDTAEAIGQVAEAKEDSRGLWIRGVLYDSQLAQETRGKIIASPKAYGMSVGYTTVRASDIYDEQGKVTGKELQELKLYEVTVTAVPANEETSAEAKSGTAPAAKTLAEVEAEVKALRDIVTTHIAPEKPKDTDKAPEGAAKSAALASFEAARMRRKRISLRHAKE